MKKILYYTFVITFIFFIAFPSFGGKIVSKVDEWSRAPFQKPFVYKEANYNVSIYGEAAIVLNQENGDILFRKNENEKLYPASTTKILTALLALEKGNLKDLITVGNEVYMREEGESTAFLSEGQQLTLEQLLSGLMLPSGNDAARTIAIYVAGLEWKNANMTNEEAMSYFVHLMNEKAAALGANTSHFTNPHGLHDPEHYSSAYDLALIAREAMGNEDFRRIVSQEQYVDETLTYDNRNKLLNSGDSFYYEGANGIKTGYTSEAGNCLVSSATKDGKKVIAVVLKSTKEEVWNDSVALLDNGFSVLGNE